MRTFVFLLILANGVVYAWNAGYFGNAGDGGAVATVAELEPARIRVVGHGEKPPVARQRAEPAAVVEPAEFCLAWDKLAPADADRLASALAEKFPGVRAERHSVPGPGGDWWVHIPPLAGKAEADKRSAELKLAGVSDTLVIQDGPNRFAISLGVFSAEKRAEERLAELKAKGVRGARLAQRPGREPLAAVEARGPFALRAELLGTSGDLLPKASAQACP
ncbi:MAG: SPOR domain-containing protein [Betaproteobacteria bacterium]|nr:SPOR domain-containing protein [Betaproteobacteria bacterium]